MARKVSPFWVTLMRRMRSGPCWLKSLSHSDAAILAPPGLSPSNHRNWSGRAESVATLITAHLVIVSGPADFYAERLRNPYRSPPAPHLDRADSQAVPPASGETGL